MYVSFLYCLLYFVLTHGVCDGFVEEAHGTRDVEDVVTVAEAGAKEVSPHILLFVYYLSYP